MSCPRIYLLQNTDPALVSMEMDIGWVIAGGADPVAYLTKYPNRFRSVHIKDLKNEGIPNTNGKMVSAIIGQGIVDWGKMLPAVKKSSGRDAPSWRSRNPTIPRPSAWCKPSAAYLKGKLLDLRSFRRGACRRRASERAPAFLCLHGVQRVMGEDEQGPPIRAAEQESAAAVPAHRSGRSALPSGA